MPEEGVDLGLTDEMVSTSSCLYLILPSAFALCVVAASFCQVLSS